MVATFDSPCSAGPAWHFPSPTHVHHADPTSAIRSLRRSMSRSPSKMPAFRLFPSKSPSPSPTSPLTPSPVSPPPGFDFAAARTPSPLAVPFPPSAKVQRASVRKAYPTRASSRSRTSPASAVRRPLSQARDYGNGRPSSPARSRSGDGADRPNPSRSASPADPAKRESDLRDRATARALMTAKIDRTLPTTSGPASAASSPLKRSDGIMNLDQASLGSPVAKRRSLHGAAFGADFNVFEHARSARPSEDRLDASRASEAAWGAAPAPAPGAPTAPFVIAMPKRSSSLRKSTLQQRYAERPIFAQSRPNADLAFDFAHPAAAAQPKPKPHRMSLDHFLPAVVRDSPFTSAGPLPNASAHPLPAGAGAGWAPLGRHGQAQPHPLSQAISQSSSASSLADDSPTHVPVHRGESPATTSMDFAKSLPIGALRPTAKRPIASEPTHPDPSTGSPPYATPQNYRLVKPLPAAFMSTGLISKRNRHPDDPLPGGVRHKASMPDTPCKKPSMAFPAAPLPAPRSTAVSPQPTRGDGDGGPFTPIQPPRSHLTATGGATTGVGIFGSKFVDGSAARRGSFLSIDGDDPRPSSSGPGDDQPVEDELPPTPTKQVYSRGGTPLFRREAGTASGMDRLRFSKTVGRFSGFAMGLQSAREARSSSPIDHLDLAHRSSPRTPQESVLPPDPSGLSISGQASGHGSGLGGHLRNDASIFLPATPTGGRDGQPHGQGRVTSITPIGGFVANDVDASLMARFEKVELIGTGEFSQVYRVTQKVRSFTPLSSLFDTSPHSPRTSSAPVPDQVFAVKKSRHPYAGARDRQRKMQEVNVLRALGRSDHVVRLIDDWEDRGHLYIQTEFCDEGSLDLFLTQVGRKARLDDFRIWKILLELSLGLKHIHDSGFIHLDLKPANVLITFEGVLKIGDFGMAACWPAQAGIEGEGDREYIGPEILMGQFDKPADIFALGLIMLEIAGNVELPDNGPSWQKLRAGDMSDVPSLTWSSASHIFRDSSGNPISPQGSPAMGYDGVRPSEGLAMSSMFSQEVRDQQEHIKSYQPGVFRDGELREPPSFMADPQHEQALDRIVRWMISPKPHDRPVVDQILNVVGVKWVETRRRAGAIVYEGNWGPADDVLAGDVEMQDV